MDFFDPPTIDLQKSKFTKIGDRYLCTTKTKSCSINLTLSGAQKNIIYTWKYDDGEIIISKNPRSKSIPIGSSKIVVTASYNGSDDIIWIETISTSVEKIIKPKKSKKIKKNKKIASKKTPKKEIKTLIIASHETEKIPEDDIPYTTMALFGGILPFVFLRRFFIKKI